jgi:hypothetical protein
MSFAARTMGRTSGGVPFLTTFASSADSVTGLVNVTMTAASDGQLSVAGNGTINTGTISPNPGWFSQTTTGIGNNYEIRVTVTSGGPFNTGTVGSWLALSTGRDWTISTTSSKSIGFNIEIRLTAGATVATANGCTIDLASGA